MKKAKIVENLRNIARFGKILIRRPHCLERMEERNVNMDDIENVLIWGTVEEIEKTETNTWKCVVKGNDIDGDELTCVAILLTETNALCITVF